MKRKLPIAALTIVLLLLSGTALHYASVFQSQRVDADSKATKRPLYGQKDYNNFLAVFRLDPADKAYDVVSLHTENTVYVLLVNTKRPGGAAVYENMSAPSKKPMSLALPSNPEDAKYKEHIAVTAAFLGQKGYQVTVKPFDALTFRSMVHSGHFDVVLLEKRDLS